jgi:2',3'-cyclic-nucleotide 2'-phosphodiesterase (5'-nucleotidase family)
MLNLLKYDAWILGNHEFDFGEKRLNLLGQEAHMAKLAGNLIWPEAKFKLLKWKLFRKNGITLALIGATLPDLTEDLWSIRYPGIKTVTIGKMLEQVMPEVMKSKPDMIILAVHSGLYGRQALNPENSFFKLSAKYPQINLILGGHTHLDIPGKKLAYSTWYAQAGCHAQGVLKVNVSIDPDNHQLISLKSKIIPVSPTTPTCKAALELEKPWLESTSKASTEVIGINETELNPSSRKAQASSINDFFCAAIAGKANTRIAFHKNINRAVLPKGKITLKDIFKIFPYADTIATLELSGEEIRQIIKESFNPGKHGKPLLPWGIHAEIDRQGNISGKIKFADGSEWLDENQKIKAAFSSYELSGTGGLHPILKKIAKTPVNNPTDTGILIENALADYLKEHSPLRIKAVQWLKISDK